MATIGDLLAGAVERLRAAGSESPRLDAELLLAHVLDVERASLLAHRERPVGPEPVGRFEAVVARREAGEPVAYIRGVREFHGIAVTVDPRALIPRPETELLVDLALGEVGERLARGPRPPGTLPVAIADVGTGSGAIAVALAVGLRRRGMLEEVQIIASDVDGDAADVARENAVGHGVADRVGVIVADLVPPPGRPAGLVAVPWEFDLVCANLPYIASEAVADLPRAISFEPVAALDGGADGLDVIRRLLAVLPERTAPDGVALLEIGADQEAGLRAAAAELLAGWPVRIEPDLAGLPRVAVLGPRQGVTPLGTPAGGGSRP